MDLSEEEKQSRYGSIDAELEKLNEKKRLLEERISQIDQKQCAICLNTLEDPIMLTCTHLFCGRCLVEWIVSQRDKLRPPCPTCREPILFQRLVAVIKGAGDGDDERRRSHQEASTSAAGTPEELTQQIGRYSKEEVILKLLRQKPDGRFLIFAKNDGSMLKIMTLLTENRILWAELKGNTPTMLSVMEKFRTNWYKVILLRPQHAGSGIDLSMATDVILFHKLFEDRTQAIGRAQRVGRQSPLTIHNLCYIQEMNDNAV
jgi:SNF2 family DNA or RNA helicase